MKNCIKNLLKVKKNGFLSTLDYFQEILEKLIRENKISPNTRIIARIKDIQSALSNDTTISREKSFWGSLLLFIGEELKEQEKKLDDIFGMTIVAESEEDKEKILARINEAEKNGSITRATVDKHIDAEDRIYREIHMLLYRTGEKNPVIECKLMLREDYENVTDHTLYKVKCLRGKSLKEDELDTLMEKIREFIQQFYNNGRFQKKENVPQMWESTYIREIGRMKRKLLSKEDCLKTVYPFIEIDTSRLD